MGIDVSSTQSYQRLASMQKINSASDNPANSAISEKLSSQAKGLEQGTENTKDMQNLAKTAEGTLNSVQEQLQQMRELTVQASNGTLTKSDKKAIQSEINQIKDSINQQGNNTEFNNQKLLDGSFQNKKVASNADGKGSQLSIGDVSTSSLGVDGIDVTANADIGQIDQALEKVSSARNDLGSKYNGLEYSSEINEINRYNTISANSRIKDANPGQEISNIKRNQILEQYQYFAQNQETDQNKSILNLIS